MEFTKLSEIAVGTVTENTHVIAEVNGEIKRVPKTEVGGSKGYIMTLTPDNFDYGTMVCTENYDEMYDILLEGGTVWIDASFLFAANGDTGTVRTIPLNWAVITQGLMIEVRGAGEYLTLYFVNGSHNFVS